MVELQDVEPRISNIYANWLMRRRLYIDCESAEEKVMTDQYFLAEEKVMTDQYFLAFKAYALGDRLLDRDFKDAMTDATAFYMIMKKDGEGDKFNSAFLVGLVKELSKKKSDDLEDGVARCAFHEHASGAANCYRNQFK
ncbi:hypothetical protein NU219Hw_g7651t1 [Hortaea werneckii]